METSKKIKLFLEKAQSCDVLFVGGLDRAGTTKVGHVLGCLGFQVIQEVSSISAKLMLTQMPESGEFTFEKKTQDLKEYYSILDNNSSQSKAEQFKFFYHEIFKTKGRFIETSPINLEMYHLLRDLDLNVCFIFLKRDINDLWMSYKNLSWGPISFADLTKEVERKLLQLYGVRDADDTLLLDYDEISILEQLVPNELFDMAKHEIPSFTRDQHKSVLKPFKSVKYKLCWIDAYAAGRSYISSESRKTFSFFCELLVLFFEVARIFKKKYLRFMTRF